jgi:hypothetical protein
MKQIFLFIALLAVGFLTAQAQQSEGCKPNTIGNGEYGTVSTSTSLVTMSEHEFHGNSYIGDLRLGRTADRQMSITAHFHKDAFPILHFQQRVFPKSFRSKRSFNFIVNNNFNNIIK